MKVVMAHNFIGPHGGAELCMLFVHQLFQAHGHESYMFGSNFQPYFEPNLPHADLFPTYINYDALKTPLEKASAMLKPFWNIEAKQKFGEFLDRVQPDLVHFNSIHWHLSPSIIASCVERKIPTVMTLHDSRQACPAGTMVRHGVRGGSGGEFCEELLCVQHGSGQAIKHRCYEKSLAKSAYVAAEYQFRKMHRQFDQIQQFICSSQALADVIHRSGVPLDKLNVIHNFAEESWLSKTAPTQPGEYFLFAGRLCREKGVHLLIEAMAQLPRETRLKIVGEGEEREALEQQVRDLKLTRVEFLGRLDEHALKPLVRDAIAVVLPCFWFENCPCTLIEALASGRPAIASDIGGCGEIILHEHSGLLVKPNHVDALASALRRLVENPAEAIQFGKQALQRAYDHFSGEPSYQKHLAVYEKVLNRPLPSEGLRYPEPSLTGVR